MSRYDELKKFSDRLNRKKFWATFVPSLLLVVTVVWLTWNFYNKGLILLLSMLGCLLIPLLFHYCWKTIVPSYKTLLRDIESVAAEISKLSRSVREIYERYPARQRGQQFKQAYNPAKEFGVRSWEFGVRSCIATFIMICFAYGPSSTD